MTNSIPIVMFDKMTKYKADRRQVTINYTGLIEQRNIHTGENVTLMMMIIIILSQYQGINFTRKVQEIPVLVFSTYADVLDG